MKDITIVASDPTGESAYDSSNPMANQEKLAYDLRKNLRNMAEEGMQIQIAEGTDFSTFGANLQGAIDNYETRFDELLADGVSSVVATIPDVLPIITALLSGGAEPVLAILLKGVLDAFLRNRDSALTAAGGEVSPDVSALTSAIEKAFLDGDDPLIERVLTKFVVNLVSDDYMQYMSTSDDEDDF